ncbi:hypothetical protein QBZ16_001044 [Prototheca wickerhamii]|uniref:Uncharacterized protein n=1 Tax=Prototheca wickerhamii TaxID=3111 RepID=A0AAD9MKK3_PROWI|nr:hypothetical protein QBZ16_001044 [Prototheca wickerhamii]
MKARSAKTKKRTANPGVRQQGGRIYDSENGTTCHQCRQKTIEIKAKCTSCTLYYCPRCLENRYQEKVDEKQGLEATGILAGVAKTAGFGSVSELLEKNPTARSLSMLAPAAKPGRPESAPKRVKKERTPMAELVDDATLGAFPPHVEFLPLCLPLRSKTPGGKQDQRDAVAMVDCPAMLLEILEFAEVFKPCLKVRSLTASKLAGELVATSEGQARLAVRDAWDVKSGPGLAKAWTHIMQRYWERLGESAAESAAHETPAAVAGELASAPAHMAPGAEDGPVSRVCPALEEERASYPPGGYWALNPAQRLRMLHALMHDALDTWHLRRFIEGQMDVVPEESQEWKAAAAKARKEARQAALAARDKEIAVLLASMDTKSMTLEAQAALVAEAKARADAEIQSQMIPAQAPARLAGPCAARAACLGHDRQGRAYWRLASFELYTEKIGAEALLVQQQAEEGSPFSESFTICGDVGSLVDSLEARGQRESALKTNIEAALKLGRRGAAAGQAPNQS